MLNLFNFYFADAEYSSLHAEKIPLYISESGAPVRTMKADKGKRVFFNQNQLDEIQNAKIQTILDNVQEISRDSVCIKPKKAISFAAFFNAIPVSFYKKYTDLSEIFLQVGVSSYCDIVLKISNGNTEIIKEQKYTQQIGTCQIKISFDDVADDGGYAWFEVHAHDNSVTVNNCFAYTEDQTLKHKKYKASIGITTFNNPDECVNQLKRFNENSDLMKLIEEIIIVDQGTKNVDQAQGYSAVCKLLNPDDNPKTNKFRYIKQANLGGSGGFARGQMEAVLGGITGEERKADAVIMLDDDVVIESESIRRAIIFASIASNPTIVGGHMFSLEVPTHLLNMGEYIHEKNWIWQSIDKAPSANLCVYSYVHEPMLSKMHYPTHNGWWMCLIPKEVVENIGLSFPGFIKWDDVEYGYRATKAGYKVVTLPSVAVWHLSWAGKIDLFDWQAYYHERNRFVTCLIHSPYRNGGRYPNIAKIIDKTYLTGMHYAAVDLRLMAVEDVLKGPDHLHKTLATQNQKVREVIKNSQDGELFSVNKGDEYDAEYQIIKDTRPSEVPRKIPRLFLALDAVRFNKKYSEYKKRHADDKPNIRYALNTQAGWWNSYKIDRLVVFGPFGKTYQVFDRDGKKYLELYKKSDDLHRNLRRNWKKLQKEYRDAFKQLTSYEQWKKTFIESSK